MSAKHFSRAPFVHPLFITDDTASFASMHPGNAVGRSGLGCRFHSQRVSARRFSGLSSQALSTSTSPQPRAQLSREQYRLIDRCLFTEFGSIIQNHGAYLWLRQALHNKLGGQSGFSIATVPLA